MMLDTSPSTELIEAVHRRTRTFSTEEILRTGKYGLIYCPLCRCTKSCDEYEPNQPNDACQDGECPCHDGWEPIPR